jgi:serine/threonine protein phosphatase PrpC
LVEFLNRLFNPKPKNAASNEPSENTSEIEEQEPDSDESVVQGEIPSTSEVPTVPISNDYADNVSLKLEEGELKQEMPQLIVGWSQSTGIQRDHNEDAFFSLTTNLTKDGSNTTIGFFIVADGMGGHKHGELASELAVRTLGSHVIQKVIISMVEQEANPPEQSLQEIIGDGVQNAHNTIVKYATGGGTTLTAALIIGGQMTIAHVGDSRAYSILNDGTMEPLTRDHSLVMRMMELGQLTEEEASIHPQRNVLYRALGQGEPFMPDISTSSVPETGYLFLCSDGLWGVVPEEEIIQIISTSTHPQQACQTLVDAANIAGGPDNITAILIQLPD